MNCSTNQRPLILITNDDGIRSPGLQAAAEAAACFGDVLISAPYRQQTGMGRAFLRRPDTGIIERVQMNIAGKDHVAYAVHGTPALSVSHAVLELADRKPDICISGINYGENLGQVLSCSGTVGAALEAVSLGIPAVAVSLEAELKVQRSEQFGQVDWGAAQWILKKIMKGMLEEGMPRGVDLWNINVPAVTKGICDFRVTRQSRQNYFCFQKGDRREKEDWSRPYQLPSKREVEIESLEKDSDIYALYIDRKISVTPLCVDMTAEKYIESLGKSLYDK